MASTIKQRLRRYNGTDYDTIHLETDSSAIYHDSTNLYDIINQHIDAYTRGILPETMPQITGDCNNITTTGIYWYNNRTCINGPSMPSGYGGKLIVLRSDNSYKIIHQMVIPELGSYQYEVYVRYGAKGDSDTTWTWHPWNRRPRARNGIDSFGGSLGGPDQTDYPNDLNNLPFTGLATYEWSAESAAGLPSNRPSKNGTDLEPYGMVLVIPGSYCYFMQLALGAENASSYRLYFRAYLSGAWRSWVKLYQT